MAIVVKLPVVRAPPVIAVEITVSMGNRSRFSLTSGGLFGSLFTSRYFLQPLPARIEINRGMLYMYFFIFQIYWLRLKAQFKSKVEGTACRGHIVGDALAIAAA